MLSHDYFSGAVVGTVLLKVMKQTVQESLVVEKIHRWFRMDLPPLQLMFLLDSPSLFVLICLSETSYLSGCRGCFVYLLVQANFLFPVSISLSKNF